MRLSLKIKYIILITCVGLLPFINGCATLFIGDTSYVCIPPGTNFSVIFPAKPQLRAGSWLLGDYYHLNTSYELEEGSIIYTLRTTDLEESYTTEQEKKRVLQETADLLFKGFLNTFDKFGVEFKETQDFKNREAIRFLFFVEKAKTKLFFNGVFFFSDDNTLVFLYIQYPDWTIRDIPYNYEKFVESFSPAT